MIKLWIVAVLLPISLKGGEVLDKARDLAIRDATPEVWAKYVKKQVQEIQKSENSQWAFLNDRMSAMFRSFEAAPTIGRLKGIIWWLGLYKELGEDLPENWADKLEKYSEEIKDLPEKINWQELLERVKKRLGLPDDKSGE